jgi:hypothetical protein
MAQQYQWFVPAESIAREVIIANLKQYLEKDTLVYTGLGSYGRARGKPGYWTVSYDTFTSTTVQDLQEDTRLWEQEQNRGVRAYRPLMRDMIKDHL